MIFDIPELLQRILVQLNLNDISSCLLVNRLWCRITVRLLWSDPLHRISQSVILTLVSSLTESDCQLKLPKLSSKLFFDYPRFLEVLDYTALISSIRKYISTHNIDSEVTEKQLTKNILNMLVRKNVKLKCLKVLDWERSLDEDIYLLLFEFQTLVSGISKLVIASDKAKLKFLNKLSSTCHDITIIELTLHSSAINVKSEMNALKNLIESQQHLTAATFQPIGLEIYGNSILLFLSALIKADSLKELLLVSDANDFRWVKASGCGELINVTNQFLGYDCLPGLQFFESEQL